MDEMNGKIALVTGASRGVGRGIAQELGAAGSIVYVTGRSTRGQSTRPDLPGTTIEDTADLVRDAGGQAIPVRCDHKDDEQVAALFARIASDHGRLDLMVNNIWGGYENYTSDAHFDRLFWEQPLWRWDGMFTAGVRAHFTASRLAAPLMMARKRGLIVHTTAWDRGKALTNVPYDVAKTAVNRLAYMTALELRPYNVAVLALTPGFVRTEAVLDAFEIDEAGWRDEPGLARTESPHYAGRAVVALAADPAIMTRSGGVFTVSELAEEYGFRDVDGRRPKPFHLTGDDLRD